MELLDNLKYKIELLTLELEQLKFEESVVQEQITKVETQLTKLNKVFHFIKNKPLEINLTDYLSEEQLEDYNLQYDYLFEPDLHISDWLDWFYEELPFIKDKFLTFTGVQSGKQYSILELDGLVKTDVIKNKIVIVMGEPVEINLTETDLYRLLKYEVLS